MLSKVKNQRNRVINPKMFRKPEAQHPGFQKLRQAGTTKTDEIVTVDRSEVATVG